MTHDVVIAGGGVVGAAIACALADTGLQVALVDKRPVIPLTASDPYDLRVSAITLASRNLFRNLGAWEEMQAVRVHPIEGMRIWEQSESIAFDAADIGEACLGYIIENRLMQGVLLERARQLGAQYLYPTEVVELTFEDEQVTLALADGRQLAAQLVVGADGAQSRVRQEAGISSAVHDYGQKAIVATVATERPNGATALQRFLGTGPLAFLPLDAHHSSIVWSVETARADELLALDDAAFIDALHAAFGQPLGRITDVSARAGFPLRAAHADHYVRPRLGVIGDAAHRIHPLAGQGMNLGLADAAVLAEVITDARAARQDIGALRVLRRYERWRKGDNLLMLAAMNGFDRLFRAKGVIEPLRRWGLSTADRIAPAKNLVMRHASGLTGDLPRLARPRP